MLSIYNNILKILSDFQILHLSNDKKNHQYAHARGGCYIKNFMLSIYNIETISYIIQCCTHLMFT